MENLCIQPGDGHAFVAQDVVLVDYEQMAQKLFKYGAKDAFDPDRVKSLLPTARSAKRLKVTKTLDAGDA